MTPSSTQQAHDARPHRQIRASYTDRTIRVYQAFSDGITEPALAAGTFRPPFTLTRMTWIKPSFLWMMYRAGWGICEVTPLAHQIHARIQAGDLQQAQALLPVERVYQPQVDDLTHLGL